MLRLGFAVVLISAWSSAAHALETARQMGFYVASTGQALAMLDSRIDITVRGPIVETVVVQRFRNPGDRATEATYIFPLPAGAAISAMAMQIGGRTIHAAIEGRDAALRRYEAAVAAGQAAALLDQERPDVFTQSVAAIPGRGIVEVTLRYDALARYQAGAWELVVPMVVAPRHVPGTASGRATTGSGRSPDTDRAPDASRVTPAAAPGAGGSTAIAIRFVDEPTELTSPTHQLGGTRSLATLSDPRSDHDAIVRWRTPAASAGWVERDGDGGYAAVVVEAPPPAPRKAPIRVILALDRGATTRGDADAVAHPLVRTLLGALDRPDRARVIGSDAIGWSAPTDVLEAIEQRWGTRAAAFDLTRVLEAARPDGAAIVLISDGLVADDPAAIAAARRLGVPVHAIGIGAAPARATLQGLAAATGGTVRFAVAGDDLPALAQAVLADVASPPAPLAISWGALAASDIEPAALPRLGAGQAMLVLARVQQAQAANARSRGDVFAIEALAPARPVAGATTARGPLARCWARERLGRLVTGTHDRAAVTSLALGYGLVSPYTSLVAIGSEVVVQGGVKHSVAIPVSLTAGMQWHAVQTVLDGRTGTAVVEHAPPAAAPPAKRPPVNKKRPPRRAPEPARPLPAPPRAEPEPPPTASARAPQPAPETPPVAPPSPSAADATAPSAADKDEVITVTGSRVERRETSTAAGKTLSDSELEALVDGDAAGESVLITGANGRAVRLTAALGGGLAFAQGARGLLALGLRIEARRGRTALGGEASLWLGGTGAAGRALFTIARRPARWFELGVGAGLHVADDTGAASSLRLRVATPIRLLAGALRYDTALLFTRPGLAVEHALTLGVELSY